MTYGGTAPTITPRYSGFVNGDTAASLTTEPTCSTTATRQPGRQLHEHRARARSTRTTRSATCRLGHGRPAPLTVTASTDTMTYGGTVAGHHGQRRRASERRSGRRSSAPGSTCTTTATSASPVGSYPTSCAGAVDANYAITYVNGSISVGFTQACITSTDSGSLTVVKGQAVCISSGGKVTGSVTVASGGALWVSGGSIGGSLSSTSAHSGSRCAERRSPDRSR